MEAQSLGRTGVSHLSLGNWAALFGLFGSLSGLASPFSMLAMLYWAATGVLPNMVATAALFHQPWRYCCGRKAPKNTAKIMYCSGLVDNVCKHADDLIAPIEAVYGAGTDWRAVAQDRQMWAALEEGSARGCSM